MKQLRAVYPAENMVNRRALTRGHTIATRGLTLVEFLVVIARLLAFQTAMLLPAVQAARKVARRSQLADDRMRLDEVVLLDAA